MRVKFMKSSLEGCIKITSSKSLAHRALICASLAQGESVINELKLSDDISATKKALELLGAKIEINDVVRILGIKKIVNPKEINALESGSTLRFIMPIAFLAENRIIFRGEKNLPKRPMAPLYKVFEKMDMIVEKLGEDELPVKISGKLKAGNYEITGLISSQYISGLLMALPLLEEDSNIKITDILESKSYIDLTIETLKIFGITIENKNYQEFFIKGNQKYLSKNYTIEGDYSQGAFFIVGAIISGDLKISGLEEKSLQGDKELLRILKDFKGDINFNEKTLSVRKQTLKGNTVSLKDIPDLGPILAVLGAFAEGETLLQDGSRLKYKESNRLKVICNELKKAKVEIEETRDGLKIKGKNSYNGNCIFNSWGDHRIAMSLAIFALGCENPVVVEGFEAINKSFPQFLEDYRKLGGIYEILD